MSKKQPKPKKVPPMIIRRRLTMLPLRRAKTRRKRRLRRSSQRHLKGMLTLVQKTPLSLKPKEKTMMRMRLPS